MARPIKINDPEILALADELGRMKIFLDLLEILDEYTTESIPAIAEMAGVSAPTIYNWVSWKVTNPHLRTLTRVAWALGYEVTLRPRERPGLVLVK